MTEKMWYVHWRPKCQSHFYKLFFNRLKGTFDFEPSKPERMLLHKELTFEKLYKAQNSIYV